MRPTRERRDEMAEQLRGIIAELTPEAGDLINEGALMQIAQGQLDAVIRMLTVRT